MIRDEEEGEKEKDDIEKGGEETEEGDENQ